MKFNIYVKNIKKMKFISKIFKIYKKRKKNWYIKSLKNFSHLALGENLFDEASSASLLFKVMVNIYGLGLHTLLFYVLFLVLGWGYLSWQT